ncbi:hypothetical protein SEUCBS140593_002338 [Sporothrix eucalyptigena]|uniref:Uncharacterized protein n=1 Tax=Sporothrix eucalyptigena TaxID=1812306 RepID=A0ABP0B5R6_9PEZI
MAPFTQTPATRLPSLATIARRQTGNGASTSFYDGDTSTPEGRHLAAIIVPSILGAALLAGGGYYTYRHFVRKRRTTKDYFVRILNGLFYTVMLTIGLPVLLGMIVYNWTKDRSSKKVQRDMYERAGTSQAGQGRVVGRTQPGMPALAANATDGIQMEERVLTPPLVYEKSPSRTADSST